MKLISSILAIGLVAPIANAVNDTNYSHETTLDFATHTEDFGDGPWVLGYRYNFEPVNQQNTPYALTNFLHQGSNVSGSFLHSDYNKTYAVSGQYVFNNKVYISGGYGRNDYDYGDANNYTVGLGYYLNDSTEIFANYSKNSGDTQGYDTESNSYNVGVSTYFNLKGSEGVFVNAMYSHAKMDISNRGRSENSYYDSDGVQLHGAWYVTKSWSINASYSRIGDDNYGLGTEYWWRVSDNISLKGSVFRNFDSDADGLNVNFGAVGRF